MIYTLKINIWLKKITFFFKNVQIIMDFLLSMEHISFTEYLGTKGMTRILR